MTRIRLTPLALVAAALALAGCGSEEPVEASSDPPEVTCQRLETAVQRFSELDPSSMEFGELVGEVREGFSEMESVADDARDTELADSITTLADTLKSSMVSSGGDAEAVRTEVHTRMQESENQAAAAYIDQTCGFDLPFDPQ